MIRKEKVTMMIPTEVEQIVSAEVKGDYGNVFVESNFPYDGSRSLKKAKEAYKNNPKSNVIGFGLRRKGKSSGYIGINVEAAIELGTALLAMASYVKGDE